MNDDALKFREFIRVVGRGERRSKALSFDDARTAMGLILEGRVDPLQRGAFLLSCRIRGEDPVEMAGFVAALQDRCARLELPPGAPAVCVGHPYDGREDTLIMGAGAALLAAAAGARVILHGAGRLPAKYAPGVADVFSAWGVPQHCSPADAPGILARLGFVHVDMRAFLPALHLQMDVREAIGLRLPFSSAEKLLDPSRCGRVVLGIAHGPYLARMTGAMQSLGIRHGLVIQGLEGSCDASPQHATRVAVVDGDKVEEIPLDPRTLGVDPAADVRALGADPANSAALIEASFAQRSDETARAVAEAIAYNAAILLWRAGLAADVSAGLALARQTLQSGAAAALLARARQSGV